MFADPDDFDDFLGGLELDDFDEEGGGESDVAFVLFVVECFVVEGAVGE